jgi:hypothetical protein
MTACGATTQIVTPSEGRCSSYVPGQPILFGNRSASVGTAQCAQPVAATYCCGVIRYSGTMSGLLSTRSNTHWRLT